MATLLHRIGRLAFRRRGLAVLLWVVVLGALGAAAVSTTSTSTTGLTLPGTESQRAIDLLDEKFPAVNADGASATIVLRAPDGQDIGDAGPKKAVTATLKDILGSSSRITDVSDPFADETVSEDGTTAYAQVTYTVKETELTDAEYDGIDRAMDAGRDRGLTVEGTGDALPVAGESSTPEIIGFALAGLILVITFGSLAAAGLPLVTALLGVGVSLAAITALGSVFDMNGNTSMLAMMLGIAVGIDYALFIVSRYRAERAAGHDAREAAARANGTAGSAVVFAGLTVVIALAGLAVVNLPVLTTMGVAAAGAVAVAVLVAVTLVPALLGFAGDRVLGRSRGRTAAHASPVTGKRTVAQRWVGLVLRRPVAALLVSVIGLGTVAVPVSGLKLGLPDDGSQPVSTTQRRAYDMLTESFGPGFNGPLTVTVDDSDPQAAHDAADSLTQDIGKLPDVAAVTSATFNEAGDTAVLTVVPKSGPSSDATKDLVAAIRKLTAGTEADTGTRAMVTGTTALNIDMSGKFSDAMVPYLMLVVALAFLVLVLVFRSLLVPLKAALGFLLSVLAALGAVVAVFQWGWLADLIGLEQTGPITSLMPILLVGIVFGLAMDYQVFLVTRMREAYVHGADARTAIESGFRSSATVVTAAALIMITVFTGFVGSHDLTIKSIGFGLAVAVACDAFVVRMTLVPAVLALLGDRAWWLPRRLDRLVPDVDIEGGKLTGGAQPPSDRTLVLTRSGTAQR
ncbi:MULTISPECIES: MMPL family transporter [Streptomyces]|uniref:RND superfamily putative drug exporter n=1 Tax=Streptomyces demainii TaxID=588122 RepID=A0ABT9L448_9ACTN|nr:MMPL family transporter [Streptomyces demainii]MDP9615095.1 RND superfamily putative drug exporter [Streptomyces demainii]